MDPRQALRNTLITLHHQASNTVEARGQGEAEPTLLMEIQDNGAAREGPTWSWRVRYSEDLGRRMAAQDCPGAQESSTQTRGRGGLGCRGNL